MSKEKPTRQTAATCIVRFMRKINKCPISLEPIPFSDVVYTLDNNKVHAYSLKNLLRHFETQLRALRKPTFPLTRQLCPAALLMLFCSRKHKTIVNDMQRLYSCLHNWLGSMDYTIHDKDGNEDRRHYFDAVDFCTFVLFTEDDISLQANVFLNFFVRLQLYKTHPAVGLFEGFTG